MIHSVHTGAAHGRQEPTRSAYEIVTLESSFHKGQRWTHSSPDLSNWGAVIMGTLYFLALALYLEGAKKKQTTEAQLTFGQA